MVFTRTELDRRTRERSKQAALKVAAQRAKDREAREAAARRKIAAKDLANQVQRENVAKFRRDRSAGVGHSQCEGHGVSRAGDPRRVRSPSSGARMTNNSTTATGSGRIYLSRFRKDSTARAETSRLEHSRVSATGDARKMLSPLSRVQTAARNITETGSGRRHGTESWRNGTTRGVEATQLGHSQVNASEDAREIHFLSSRGQTAVRGIIAAGSGRGHAAGSLRSSAAGFEASQHVRSPVSTSRYPRRMRSPPSETRNATRNVTATGSGRRNVAKWRRDNAAGVEPNQRWRSRESEPGESQRMHSSSSGAQAATRRVTATGSGGGHVAGSRRDCEARVEASHLGLIRVSAGGDPHIFFSSMERTTAGGVDTTGPGRKKVAESRGRQQRAVTRPAPNSHGKSRHETTMAFMARQRRQAALDKRRKEAEEQRKVELVRLALKELEQNRKRAISQRPHRSRSRSNRRASSHLKENALEVRRNTNRGVPREGRGSRRVRASHAARGPEPPPVNVNPVEANRYGGEGGDIRRERGGGEAASVEKNTSLEDKLPFIMEVLERTTLTVLDLQRRCARLSEVIDGPRGALPPRRPQPHEENQGARVPPPEVLVGTEEAHRPPSCTSNVQTSRRKDEASSRQATTPSKPMAHQMRRSDLILQPSTPPHPVPQPFPSSEISVGLPPMDTAVRSSRTTSNAAASSEVDESKGIPLPRQPQPLKNEQDAIPPPEVPVGMEETCRPPSTSNEQTSRQQDEVSSRPVISQPQPTEPQTRRFDLILQPLTPPHPAAQPCPFPAVSAKSVPVDEATPSSPPTNDATASRVPAPEANNGTSQSRSTISSHGTTEVLPTLSCPHFVTATSRADVSRRTVPYVSEEQSVVPTPTPRPDHGGAHAEVETKAQGDEAAMGMLAFTARYSRPTVAAENMDGLDQVIEGVVLSASTPVADARAEDKDTSSKTIGDELLGMSGSSDEGCDKTASVVETVSLRSWEIDPQAPNEERLGLNVHGWVQGDMSYVSEEQSVVPTPTPHPDHGAAHADVETKAQSDKAAPGTLAFTTRYFRPTVAAENTDGINQAIGDVVISTSAPVAGARAEDEDKSSKTIGGELLGMLGSSGEGYDKIASSVVEPVSSRSWEIDLEAPNEERLGLDVYDWVQGDMPYVSGEQSVVPTPTSYPDHGGAHTDVETKAQGDEAASGTLAFTTRYSRPTVAAENAEGIDQVVEGVIISVSASMADAWAEDEDTSSKTIGGEFLGMSGSSDEGCDITAGVVETVSLRSWEIEPEAPNEERLGLNVHGWVEGDMSYVSEDQSIVPTPTPRPDHGGAHADVETKAQGDEAALGMLAFTARYSRPTVAAENMDGLDQVIEGVVLSASAPVADARAEDKDTSSKTIGDELLGMSGSSDEGCDKTAGVMETVSLRSWEIDPQAPNEERLGLNVYGWVQGDMSYVSEEQSVVPTPTPHPDHGAAHADVETKAQSDKAAPGTLAFTTRYFRPTVAAENTDGINQAIGDVVISASVPVADARAEDEDKSSKTIGGELLGILGSSGEGYDKTASSIVEPASSRSWEIDPEVPNEERLGLDVHGLVQGDMPYVSEEQSIVLTPTPHSDHGGPRAEVEANAQGDEVAPGTLAFTTRYSRPTVAAENADGIDQVIEGVIISVSSPVADAWAEDEDASSKTIGGEFLGMSGSSDEGCDKTAGVVETVSLRSLEIDPEVPEEEGLGLDVDGSVQSDASQGHDENVVESLGTTISEVLSLSSSSPEEDGQTISGKVGATSSQFWTDSAEAAEGKNDDIYDFEPVKLTRPKTAWITAATQASEGKTEHAASSVSFTSTAGEASLGVRTGGGCQGKDNVYDFELMPLARPRTPWMAVATQASEGKTERAVPSVSFTSTADEANLGVRTGGGCQGKDDDMYDFEPTKLARPRRPWMTAATQALEAETEHAVPSVSFTSTLGEANLGVRTGGGCQGKVEWGLGQLGRDGGKGGGWESEQLNEEEEKNSSHEDDIYDFEPTKLARPRTPWMAIATQASKGKTKHAAPSVSFTSTAGEPSLGVRTGGGCQGKAEYGSGELGRGDKRGGGWESEQLNEEEEKDSSQEVGMRHDQDEEQQQEDDLRTIKEDTDWPEYPWGALLADAIKTALSSMTLEELNDRMEILNYPVEPFLEELEGEDTMEFPPPPEAPVEEDAVIPPRVLDALLEVPEEEARASLGENGGHPTPDREAVDAARWMAVEVANEYLAKRREARDPRRLCAPPPPNGKILQHFKGFRFFKSVEEAIQEVTEAVLREDSSYQSGRGRTSEWVQTLPLPTTREDENLYEEDEYFLKCKVAEDILHGLLDDTVQECKRVYDRQHMLATSR